MVASTYFCTADFTAGRALSGAGEPFSDLLTGEGNFSTRTADNPYFARLRAGTSSNWYSINYRAFFSFPTSALESDMGPGEITGATIYLYLSSRANQLGGGAYGFTPASTGVDCGTAAATMYSGYTTQRLGPDVAYADLTLASYEPWVISSSCFSLLNTTMETVLCFRGAWDIDNTTNGSTWASGSENRVQAYTVDYTGATRDPKIVITYTTTASAVATTTHALELVAATLSAFTAPLYYNAALQTTVSPMSGMLAYIRKDNGVWAVIDGQSGTLSQITKDNGVWVTAPAVSSVTANGEVCRGLNIIVPASATVTATGSIDGSLSATVPAAAGVTIVPAIDRGLGSTITATAGTRVSLGLEWGLALTADGTAGTDLSLSVTAGPSGAVVALEATVNGVTTTLLTLNADQAFGSTVSGRSAILDYLSKDTGIALTATGITSAVTYLDEDYSLEVSVEAEGNAVLDLSASGTPAAQPSTNYWFNAKRGGKKPRHGILHGNPRYTMRIDKL